MIKKLYLVTGATGHLGTILLTQLREQDADLRALVLPHEMNLELPQVQKVSGNVLHPETLPPFFARDDYDEVTLFHCAAAISIASKPDPNVWRVNVDGTENIMTLARAYEVDRIVYVSSVHAIEERPNEERIVEPTSFDPKKVHGQYAQSKAAAAQYVLNQADRGLNVSIVHPSGIIGPGDRLHQNHMVQTIRAMARGKIRASVRGQYDFVDVRDVARGIIQCETQGQPGACYILNGSNVTVRHLLATVCSYTNQRIPKLEVPATVAKWIAPIAETFTRWFSNAPSLLTPYSIYTLQTNANFSHDKATQELGYAPRSILTSIRDTVDDLLDRWKPQDS